MPWHYVREQFVQLFEYYVFGAIGTVVEQTLALGVQINVRKKKSQSGTITFGLTLKNIVDIWTFVRVSAKITACHCVYLVLV